MMRYLLLCVVASFCLAPHPAGAAELYDRDGQAIDITVAPTWPAPPGLRRQPVLFVHGHADDTNGDPNYIRNFWTEPTGLTSFKRTLDDNSGLDIEPYYIWFEDRTRSITDDAFDIGQVVDYIVRRHNENFDPANATSPPPVQVVIIGYSKGTISSRQYLKSLLQQVAGHRWHFDAGAAARFSAGFGVHRHCSAQPRHFIATLRLGRDRPDLGPAALQRRAARWPFVRHCSSSILCRKRPISSRS